ncbi:MAG: hypothetical protein JXR27_10550 [Paludibacteraceae bacterium]|nr:hypothetical protein [Paludibacteraceae bacterium]
MDLPEKVTLKSGKSYIGEILLRNDEVLVLKMIDGTRFQFRISEVEAISEAKANEAVEPAEADDSDHILTGMVDVNVGVAHARFKSNASAFTGAGISFGTDRFADETVFWGIGVGYLAFSLAQSDDAVGFIPVFFRARKVFNRNIVSPMLMFDAGYAFSTENTYEGGVYTKLNFGMLRRLNYKTSFFAALYAGVAGYGGQLTEQTNQGSFNFVGKTAFVAAGVTLGFQF